LWALKTSRLSYDAVILLHDNSEPHAAHQTWKLLQKFGLETLNHPPRSPDLEPSDLRVVTALKGYLSGHNFTFDETAIRWLKQEVTCSVLPGWTNLLHTVKVLRLSRGLCGKGAY
jgi:hypothetical protein